MVHQTAFVAGTKNPSVLSWLLSGASLPGHCKRPRDCLATHSVPLIGHTRVRSFDQTFARLPSAPTQTPLPLYGIWRCDRSEFELPLGSALALPLVARSRLVIPLLAPD